MECDICGKREASFIVEIEGAKMAACRGCAYHGRIVLSLEESPGPTKPVDLGRGPKALKLEEDLMEGYGKTVRKAREARNMKIEELANQINEKASYLDKIENESIRIPLKTAKKLERALNIKILEKVEDAEVPSELTKRSKKELSLLDMLEMQNKKKGK
ncbi:TIGR00270 family protein [Candidatus Micrarchaeota archaeon]|nr:TIGR00270 family protein [Candidatus Micrarchaeota archaeon]